MEEDLLNLIEEADRNGCREYIHYNYIKKFVKECFNKIDMQDFFIAMVIKEACSMPYDVDAFTMGDMNEIYDTLYKDYVDDIKSTLINPRWIYKKDLPKRVRKRKRRKDDRSFC